MFTCLSCNNTQKRNKTNMQMSKDYLNPNGTINSEALYVTFKELLENNGYIITADKREGEGDYAYWHLSAKNGKIEFSQMLEGYYLEPTLSVCSSNSLILYFILDGRYNTDIFVDIPQSHQELETNKIVLEEEINRLGLDEFILLK